MNASIVQWPRAAQPSSQPLLSAHIIAREHVQASDASKQHVLGRPPTDAAQFDEKKARFDVPFTAKSAGDHKIMANVKFAVCTDENCVPDERDLALAVAVN